MSQNIVTNDWEAGFYLLVLMRSARRISQTRQPVPRMKHSAAAPTSPNKHTLLISSGCDMYYMQRARQISETRHALSQC